MVGWGELLFAWSLHAHTVNMVARRLLWASCWLNCCTWFIDKCLAHFLGESLSACSGDGCLLFQ
jgi:hypothetical protein